MKRASILLTLLALAALSGTANAATRDFNRSLECRYSSLQGDGTMNIHEAKLTIACAVHKMPVAGGVTRALCIAERESGFYEKAYNPSGSSGIYQVIPSTWASWTAHFANWRHQHAIPTNVFSGRANILVSIKSARTWGWGPWGNSC